MANYFNTLPLREQLAQLAKCRFMDSSEFADGVEALKGKKWLLSVVVHKVLTKVLTYVILV